MSKEAMKLALQIAIDYMNDRLEDHDCKYQRHPATEAERINILADIETVKEALAKQEQGEPVAEYIGNNPDELDLSKRIGLIHRLKFIPLRSKLYTTPQQRKPLTDEQRRAIILKADTVGQAIAMVETAHGIKE